MLKNVRLCAYVHVNIDTDFVYISCVYCFTLFQCVMPYFFMHDNCSTPVICEHNVMYLVKVSYACLKTGEINFVSTV
jgi:hypothetical protein